MAKETMQAVSDAEKSARQTLLHAKGESEALIAQAKEQAEKLIASAKKEAAKKVEVLCGVARADAEKLKARTSEETLAEQKELRQSAENALPRAAEEIKKLVLGQAETAAPALKGR